MTNNTVVGGGEAVKIDYVVALVALWATRIVAVGSVVLAVVAALNGAIGFAALFVVAGLFMAIIQYLPAERLSRWNKGVSK